MSVLRSATECLLPPGDEISSMGFQFGITSSENFFSEGRNECLKLEGGDMASIHSAFENEAIENLIRADGRDITIGMWIGFFDEVQISPSEYSGTDRFSWLDGSDFDFGATPETFPWNINGPNNHLGAENCGIIVDYTGDGAGLIWEDEDCSKNFRPSICRVSCVIPTASPSFLPTSEPTNLPTLNPSALPTFAPTKAPILSPTVSPTKSPFEHLTETPTTNPTLLPTVSPTKSPFEHLTESPTTNPTLIPTNSPQENPTSNPSLSPTLNPTLQTFSPTLNPMDEVSQEKAVLNPSMVITLAGIIGVLALTLLFWAAFFKKKPRKYGNRDETLAVLFSDGSKKHEYLDKIPLAKPIRLNPIRQGRRELKEQLTDLDLEIEVSAAPDVVATQLISAPKSVVRKPMKAMLQDDDIGSWSSDGSVAQSKPRYRLSDESLVESKPRYKLNF